MSQKVVMCHADVCSTCSLPIAAGSEADLGVGVGLRHLECVDRPLPNPAVVPTPLSFLEPLHPYTAEAVIVVTRTINARKAEEVEEYMRGQVAMFPELTLRSSVDITVTPVKCDGACVTCDASKERLEAIRVANVREYLEFEAMKLSTDIQRSRMKTDAGREVELRAIARGVLFAPLDGLTRRAKLHAKSVRHQDGCQAPDVAWSADARGAVNRNGEIVGVLGQPYRGLTREETATLDNVRSAAGIASQHEWLSHHAADPALTLHVVTHRGTCVTCGGSYAEHGVLVTVQWAGRPLSREYLL